MNKADLEMFVQAYRNGDMTLRSAVLGMAMYRLQVDEPITVKEVITLTNATRSRAYDAVKHARESLGRMGKTLSPNAGRNCPQFRDKRIPESGIFRPGIRDDTFNKELREITPLSPPTGGRGEISISHNGPGVVSAGVDGRARRPSKRRDPEGWRRQLEKDLEGI